MSEFHRMKCNDCNWSYASSYISQAHRLSEDHMMATGHTVYEVMEVI